MGIQTLRMAYVRDLVLKYEFQLDESANLQDGKWFAVARPGGFPYFGVILPNDKIRVWNAAGTQQELTTSLYF